MLDEAITAASMALAERLDAPVCVGYQHNDAFPGSHPLFAGPLGYNGSKAGMELIAKADVILALGTRLNPFSTLPGYGIDYYYYVVALQNGASNPGGGGTPAGRALRSSRYYTQTYSPARLQREQGRAMDDIRVVPRYYTSRHQGH